MAKHGLLLPAIHLFAAALLASCGSGTPSDSSAPSATSHAQVRHAAKPLRSIKAVGTTASDYQDAVQELYIAYFGRPADPNGLANFEAALLAAQAPTDLQTLAQVYGSNAAVKSLIDSFQTSNESLALYGGSTTTAFVQAVFQNVLGRQPAQAGLDFWVGAIGAGTLTQSDAALAIMAGGTVNTTPQGLIDAQLIANRIAAATYFTAQLSALGDTKAYSGKAAAQAARTMLGTVGASTTEASYQTATSSTITGLVASGSLGGIAATGAPMAGAAVTLKDVAGNTRTATTGSDGSFSISLSGLTPPMLLQVSANGTTWYSYAGASNATANLNAYTSVLLQAFYKAAGTDVATVFNGTLSANSVLPGQDQIAQLAAPVVNNLQPFLGNAGVTNAAQFNPFTAAFSANGNGFDQVLDRTVVTSGLTGYTVDNGSGGNAGSLSSSVTLTATPASGGNSASVAVSSTTTNGNNTSSAQANIPVATSTLEQSDLAAAESGVLDLLQTLGQLSASGTLTSTSVLPYIDPNFLDEGRTQATFATQAANDIGALLAVSTVSIYRVNSFTDGSTKYLNVTLQIVAPNGLVAYSDDNDNPNTGIVFKQAAGGSWVFYGNQVAYNPHVDLQQQRCYGCAPQVTDTLSMQAQVDTATGALSGAAIAGPANSLPDCTKNPSPLTLSSLTLTKDAGSYDGGDRYDLACAGTSGGALAGNPPAAGTAYTFTLTPAGGSPQQIPYLLNAATNDNGDITTFNGTDRASFAAANKVAQVAGTTLTVTFTPPTTFQVLYSFLSGFCANANELGNGLGNGGGEDFNGTVGDIPPGVTSGTIVVPATCDGAPTAGLGISVWFVGVNGEKSLVVQNF